MRFMKTDKNLIVELHQKSLQGVLEAKMLPKYAFATVSDNAFVCNINGDKRFMRHNT